MNRQQVFYHIYPLGLCGAPLSHDNQAGTEHRILKLVDWIEHLEKLGITALYLGPVFESDRHGYDTRNYRKIDTRLGSKEDMQKVCQALHEHQIKVVFDGVFNHVGRGCPFFQDVLLKKEDSVYKDWFYLDFNQSDNPDGFTYANWEGHAELVKWNLDNVNVKSYLLQSVQTWIDDYHIDGIRLDVAYTLNQNFLSELNHFCKSQNPDFFLLGEMIGGDYNYLLKPYLCDSVTNYECRKGIYSAFNSHNLFEIAHSLQRQFGSEPWSLYRDIPLYSFVDNHDVDRIASIVNDQRDLPLIYSLLFAMPGIPAIYYGSEWATTGVRTPQSDMALRPEFLKPKWNNLTDFIALLAKLHQTYPVFADGNYQQLHLTNEQFVFSRNNCQEQLICCINAANQPVYLPLKMAAGQMINLKTNEMVSMKDGLQLEAKTTMLLYKKNGDY